MKILKKIILFTFIGVVFATCKKETLTPSSTVGQPVFSFNGSIGGTSLNWQAGVNNYYMQTTYSQSDSGVYSFMGTLQNTLTPNSSSIQIIINDNTKVSPNTPSNISASLTPSPYYYNIPGGNPIWDSVTFRPFSYAGSPTKYTYNFGDGNIYTQPDAYPVRHLYKILKNYSTSLTVVSSNGSPTVFKSFNLTKQVTKPILIDSISSQIIGDTDTAHTLSLTANISGGVSPYTYLWDFGDLSSISTSTNANISHTYTSTPAHIYTITVGVIDNSHDYDTCTFPLYDSTAPQKFHINYTTTIKGVPNPNSLSNVTVNYTDDRGIQYTSNNSQQPGSSTFVVTSVSSYQKNTNNQQTKMLTVTFNCMLYPVLGGTPISATNCTATIAVAYQ